MVLMASWPARTPPQQAGCSRNSSSWLKGGLERTELTPEDRRLRSRWGRWLSLQQASGLHPGFQVCGALWAVGSWGPAGCTCDSRVQGTSVI